MKASSLFQTKPVDRPLLAPKGKSEVALASFSFLFSEFVQYSQSRVSNIGELERRLEDGGYGVGFRLLEVLSATERGRAHGLLGILRFVHGLLWTDLAKVNGRRRDTRLLDALRFVHGPLWKYLFGRNARDLEQSNTAEDEYMISDTDLFVNQYVSVPKDMGGLNCAAFVAGIVKGALDNAGFPARVTAHYVPVEGQARPKTTILMKFEASVMAREGRLPAA